MPLDELTADGMADAEVEGRDGEIDEADSTADDNDKTDETLEGVEGDATSLAAGAAIATDATMRQHKSRALNMVRGRAVQKTMS